MKTLSDGNDTIVDIIMKNASCFLFDALEYYYFDLNPINNKSDIVFSDNDGSKLYINFCQFTNINSCQNEKSLVTVKYNNETCKSFTKSDKTKEWTYNITDPSSVTLSMKTDLICNYEKNYTTNFIIYCDENMADGSIEPYNNLLFNDSLKYFFNLSPVDCQRNISFKAKNACVKYDKYIHFKLHNEYSYIYGLFFILFGFFLAFLGNYHEDFTLNIFVLFIINSLFRILFIFIEIKKTQEWVIFVADLLVWILGIIIAGFIKNSEKLQILSYGFLLGICTSRMIYLTAFIRITIYPYLIFFLVLFISIITVSLITYFFVSKTKALIYSSSICGSIIAFTVFLLIIF
jgi:hypothetical protein